MNCKPTLFIITSISRLHVVDHRVVPRRRAPLDAAAAAAAAATATAAAAAAA